MFQAGAEGDQVLQEAQHAQDCCCATSQFLVLLQDHRLINKFCPLPPIARVDLFVHDLQAQTIRHGCILAVPQRYVLAWRYRLLYFLATFSSKTDYFTG